MPTHDDEGARLTSPQSRVQVSIISGTSAAANKASERPLYVMRDAADPDGNTLYFTAAEWEAFVKGVKDGEFDLDARGDLPQHTKA